MPPIGTGTLERLANTHGILTTDQESPVYYELSHAAHTQWSVEALRSLSDRNWYRDLLQLPSAVFDAFNERRSVFRINRDALALFIAQPGLENQYYRNYASLHYEAFAMLEPKLSDKALKGVLGSQHCKDCLLRIGEDMLPEALMQRIAALAEKGLLAASFDGDMLALSHLGELAQARLQVRRMLQDADITVAREEPTDTQQYTTYGIRFNEDVETAYGQPLANNTEIRLLHDALRPLVEQEGEHVTLVAAGNELLVSTDRPAIAALLEDIARVKNPHHELDRKTAEHCVPPLQAMFKEAGIPPERRTLRLRDWTQDDATRILKQQLQRECEQRPGLSVDFSPKPPARSKSAKRVLAFSGHIR